MATKVIAIACIREHDQAIGANGDLLFGIKADMRFFVEQTTGHAVIMGRKNWDSIPEQYRPFKDRLNIVLTRRNNLNLPEGVFTAHSFEDAILFAKRRDHQKIFVIGGGEIYRQALDARIVDEVLLTVISDAGKLPEADTFFHQTDEWRHGFVQTMLEPPTLQKDRKSGNEVTMKIILYSKIP